MAKLTHKQQRFVDEYLVDLNATQAARRAGYSDKTARQVGAENLSKPAVAAAIAERTAQRSQRTQIDADWVLREAQDLYESCRSEGDNKTAARSLELIGKHTDVAAWKDRIEHSGQIDVAQRILDARKRAGSGE